MNTFLFIWNPKIDPWETIEKEINKIERKGKARFTWRTGGRKNIQIGDRIFMVKLGTYPKGIIGVGHASSIPFERSDGRYVYIDFEVLLNPLIDPILDVDKLKTGKLSEQHSWTPQSSGSIIKPEIAAALEKAWFKFLTNSKVRNNPYNNEHEVKPIEFFEGASNQITVNKYERNPHARKECLKHYGYACSVCDINFEKKYGVLGKEFIHVHHLEELSKAGESHKVDPVKDLRPVCPNCHAMLHRDKEVLTIKELKTIMINCL